MVTADQRVDLALGGALVEVVLALFIARFRYTVGDEIDYVQAGDILLSKQVDAVAVLLAKHGNQHVLTADFLLAGRLHVEHRALKHTLETQRRLGITGITVVEQRGVFLDVAAQLLARS